MSNAMRLTGDWYEKIGSALTLTPGVQLNFSYHSEFSTYPSMVDTAFRNMAYAGMSESTSDLSRNFTSATASSLMVENV